LEFEKLKDIKFVINKEAPHILGDLLDFWEIGEKEATLKDIRKQFKRIDFESGIAFIKRDAINGLATPGVTWFYQKRYPVKGKRELMFCGCAGEPDKIRPDIKENKCSCIIKRDTKIEDNEIEKFVEKIKEMEKGSD